MLFQRDLLTIKLNICFRMPQELASRTLWTYGFYQ